MVGGAGVPAAEVEKVARAAKKLGVKPSDVPGTTKEIQNLLGKAPCTASIDQRQGIFESVLSLLGGVAYASGPCGKNVADIYEAAAKNKPVGRGSTGRSEPANLKEQAALLVTKADPQNGRKLDIELTDSRWPSSEGWEKWESVFRNEGQNIVIHYVRNPGKGLVDDFKFKN